MRSKRDPVNRLVGYGKEVASFLRRRRQKRSPRVVMRWLDGTAESVDAVSQEGQSILNLADLLIGISEDGTK